MTIERRLSKAQARTVVILAEQREALARQMAEVNEALNEQAELLRTKFELPDGTYHFFGDAEGVKLVRRAGGDAGETLAVQEEAVDGRQ